MSTVQVERSRAILSIIYSGTVQLLPATMAAMQSVFISLWQTSSGSIYSKSMRWYRGCMWGCLQLKAVQDGLFVVLTRQKTLVATCEPARNSVQSLDRTRSWADCDWIKVNLVHSLHFRKACLSSLLITTPVDNILMLQYTRKLSLVQVTNLCEGNISLFSFTICR